MNRIALTVYVLIAVLCLVTAASFLGAGGQNPEDCPTAVEWDRERGSTSPTPQLVKGPYETVVQKRCADGSTWTFIYLK